MANAFEVWALLEIVEDFADVGFAQVDPTDDSDYEVVVLGDFEAPLGLFDGGVRLDDDGFVDTSLCQQGTEVVGSIVDPYRTAFRHPVVGSQI